MVRVRAIQDGISSVEVIVDVANHRCELEASYPHLATDLQPLSPPSLVTTDYRTAGTEIEAAIRIAQEPVAGL